MSDLDARAFLKGLKLADRRVRGAATTGMRKLMAQAKGRARELVPVLTGTLAGTIRSEVASEAAKIEGRLAAGGGEASDYAVRQHEEPMEHTHPVAGHYAAKYIERPIQELSGKAAQQLADGIRGALNG